MYFYLDMQASNLFHIYIFLNKKAVYVKVVLDCSKKLRMFGTGL